MAFRFEELMGKNAIHTTINDDDDVINQKTRSYNLPIYPDLWMFREVYSRYIKRQLKYGGEVVLVILDYELKKCQILLETFSVILISFRYQFFAVVVL
jgi:hypothetical protein